jgi:RNA polymerase sigma factor (sigma-70 family)
MDALTHAVGPRRPPAGWQIRFSRLSDELLARHATRGSQRAFAAIYERYHQPLYRYCRSIVREDADAQDALQSAFTKALAALRQGSVNAPLRPWLYRIAHNEAVSAIRRRRDRPPAFEDEAASWDGGRAAVGSLEEEVALRERWGTLIADLAELPERQRAALLLRELSGLPHGEIAIALGTTASAAKQAIFEARQALGEFSEGRAMRCEEVRRRVSDGDGRVLRGRRVRAHLRDCGGCAAFAAGIRERRDALCALAPALPAAAAANLLYHVFGMAGSSGGTSSTAVTAGIAGKLYGGALAWKALAGAALVATTAAVGVATLPHAHRPGSAGSAAGVSGSRAAVSGSRAGVPASAAQAGGAAPASVGSAGRGAAAATGLPAAGGALNRPGHAAGGGAGGVFWPGVEPASGGGRGAGRGAQAGGAANGSAGGGAHGGDRGTGSGRNGGSHGSGSTHSHGAGRQGGGPPPQPGQTRATGRGRQATTTSGGEQVPTTPTAPTTPSG